jgi:hypothetical protein
MLDTQPQVTPAPKRKKKVRKVAQQLEPLFTPEMLDETAPWFVPLEIPQTDDNQLALWAAQALVQPAP